MSAILGITEWKQNHTGAHWSPRHRRLQGFPDTSAPGTRNSGLAQIPSVSFAELRKLLVQLVFSSGGSHPVQNPAGFDCRTLCLCLRSPPSLCLQGWELSTPGLGHPCGLRHQAVLNRENAPSWHNLYRNGGGKKAQHVLPVEQSRDL